MKFFTAVTVLASIVSAQKVKFMPLGDSITEITCWRSYLWDQISDTGLASQVDFVGSMNNNPQNCRARTPNFDVNHEGHSGWLSIDIANNYLQRWLQATKPDIVHFHLGTNDVSQGRPTNAIMDSYTKMVQLMRQSNPRMKIIVDKLIPLAYSQAGIDAINSRMDQWVSSMNSQQSPITVADCSLQAGYTNSMLRDMVHPTDQGDQFMAKRIGPRVIQAIRDVIAQR